MKKKEFESAVEDAVIRYIVESKNKSKASADVVEYLFQSLSSSFAMFTFRRNPDDCSPRQMKSAWNGISGQMCDMAISTYQFLAESGYSIQEMDAEAKKNLN